MDILKYTTLKSASKVSLGKEKVVVQDELKDSDGNVVQTKIERDAIMLTEKKYDSNTGEALSDVKSEVYLDDYKLNKSGVDSQIISLTKESEAYAQIIKDIEAL